MRTRIGRREFITLLGGAAAWPQAARARQTETFNFLGFTFICGKTRQGKFQIKRKTRRDRMRAKLKMVQEEMRRRMHQPIAVQGKWLWYVVNGYFNYHAVPTNFRALVVFRSEIARRWPPSLAWKDFPHSQCPSRNT